MQSSTHNPILKGVCTMSIIVACVIAVSTGQTSLLRGQATDVSVIRYPSGNIHTVENLTDGSVYTYLDESGANDRGRLKSIVLGNGNEKHIIAYFGDTPSVQQELRYIEGVKRWRIFYDEQGERTLIHGYYPSGNLDRSRSYTEGWYVEFIDENLNGNGRGRRKLNILANGEKNTFEYWGDTDTVRVQHHLSAAGIPLWDKFFNENGGVTRQVSFEDGKEKARIIFNGEGGRRRVQTLYPSGNIFRLEDVEQGSVLGYMDEKFEDTDRGRKMFYIAPNGTRTNFEYWGETDTLRSRVIIVEGQNPTYVYYTEDGIEEKRHTSAGNKIEYYPSGLRMKFYNEDTGVVVEYVNEDFEGTGAGRIQSRKFPNGKKTEYTYFLHSDKKQKEERYENGQLRWVLYFDEEGNIIKILPYGEEVQTDGKERPIRITNPEVGTISIDWKTQTAKQEQEKKYGSKSTTEYTNVTDAFIGDDRQVRIVTNNDDTIWGVPSAHEEMFIDTHNTPVTIRVEKPRYTEETVVFDGLVANNEEAALANADYWNNEMNALRGSDVSKITIPKGTYHFARPEGSPVYLPHLYINTMSNLMIDGQDSTMIFHGQHNGFHIRMSDHITIKNFNIDWAYPLAYPGVVRQHGTLGPIFQIIGTRPFDNKTIDDFIDPDNPPLLTIVTGYDINEKKYPDGEKQFHLSYTHSDNPTEELKYIGRVNGMHTYQITNNALALKVQDGWTALGKWRGHGAAIQGHIGNQDINIEDIDVYAAHGPSFIMTKSNAGIRIVGNRVHKKNSTRYISSVADSTHIGSTGGDVIIEDNVFEHAGDDGTNFRGKHFDITDPMNGNPRKFVGEPAVGTKAGEIVEVVDIDTMRVIGSSIINTVDFPSPCNGCHYTYTLKSDIPNITGNVMYRNASRSSDNFIFRNNIVRSARARGAVIQSSNGLVEGNVIENMTIAGIVATVHMSVFNEGPAANNVIIRDNTIRHVGYGFDNRGRSLIRRGAFAAITVHSLLENQEAFLKSWRNKDIIITGNSISDVPGAGITAAAVDGITITNNILENTNTIPFETSGSASGSIFINSASNVDIHHNTFIGDTTQGVEWQ